MGILSVAALVAAAALAVLGVAAAFRLRSGLLPGLWFDPVLDAKSLRIRRLARRRWRPGVVAIGHSIVFDWLDPDEFRRADPAARSSYNAGANFTIGDVLVDWCRFVLSRWRPEAVVLGFSAVDVNENGTLQRQCANDHRATPAGRWRGIVPARVAAVQAVKAVLLHPKRVLRALRSGREALPVSGRLIGPWGTDLHKAGKTYRCNEGFQAAFRDKWLRDFAVGERELGTVADIVRIVRDSGARPVVVWAPVTDDYVALLPGGAADAAAARDAVHAVVTREGARWVEPPPGLLTLDHFADPIHLNDRGIVTMTRWLAELEL